MTPEQRHELENQKARGERIGAFLNDDMVQAIFTSLHLSYFEAWKQATDPAQREQIHATASAFDSLQESLRAVVASGERANLDLLVAESSNEDTLA